MKHQTNAYSHVFLSNILSSNLELEAENSFLSTYNFKC